MMGMGIDIARGNDLAFASEKYHDLENDVRINHK